MTAFFVMFLLLTLSAIGMGTSKETAACVGGAGAHVWMWAVVYRAVAQTEATTVGSVTNTRSGRG